MNIDPEAIREVWEKLWPTAATLIAAGVGLAIANRLLLGNVRRHESDSIVARQLVMLALTIVALVAFILVLPVGETRQGQLLQLVGLILSGAIALSSTNLLGNIMSGLMLRAVQAFRLGDFIEVGEEFGRISERGLFHVEIQTPRREFTTIPNTHLVNQPFRVMATKRTSETEEKTVVVVDAKVSLGYDVPRQEIEPHLLTAAEKAGLEEPYVRVLELGDYSVTYQVSGLLNDVERLLRTRSRLNAQILDALHGAGIEIVSPFFVNERAFAPTRSFVPSKPVETGETSHDQTPAAVFDKASSAALRERLEEFRRRLGEEIKELERRESAGEEVEGEEPLLQQIERAKRHLRRVTLALDDQEPDAKA